MKTKDRIVRKRKLQSLRSKWLPYTTIAMLAVLFVYTEQQGRKCQDYERQKKNVERQDEVGFHARRHVYRLSRWGRLDVPLATQVIRAADANRIPREIAFGLIAVESGFDSTAVSVKGAIGLTQIKLATARIYDSTVQYQTLKGVDRNLDLGFRYLRDMIDRYDGNIVLALAAYNMGPTALDKRKDSGAPISMNYVRRVIER